MFAIDTGARCEAHAGEVFPPRCADCEELHNGPAAENQAAPACGFVPGSNCPIHTDYPLPCLRCQRDED